MADATRDELGLAYIASRISGWYVVRAKPNGGMQRLIAGPFQTESTAAAVMIKFRDSPTG